MTELKRPPWCQAEDCDDTIEDDDDVVWVNYQQGECYHRGCYVDSDTS